MAVYSKTVWAHFQRPLNMSRLDGPDVYEGRAGAPRAGPFVAFTARFDGRKFTRLCFETFGCAAAIASGSVISEAVRGKTLEQAGKWDVKALLTILGGLPREKVYCAELAIEALRALLDAVEQGEATRNPGRGGVRGESG